MNKCLIYIMLTSSVQVFLSHLGFTRLEDQLRAGDVEEQKGNRVRDAEAEVGLSPRGVNDPYAPYQSPGMEGDGPSIDPYQDQFSASSQHIPLVAHASPFQRADMYDEYDERKSFRDEEYDTRSALTSNRDDALSNYGSESYAPSRNMF